MIFEALNESAERNELLLVEGGCCRFHLRRDGQLTILEILVLPGQRGKGIGSALLSRLKAMPGARSLLARCPASLPANAWWEERGFRKQSTEETRTGRRINVWVLDL